MVKSILTRCRHCHTINRVSTEKLHSTIQCGNCHQSITFPSTVVEATETNFQEEVLNEAGFVLLEFYTQSCGYCRMLLPTLVQLALDKAGLLKVVTVDASLNPQLASRYAVTGVPSLYLLNGGKVVNHASGALPKTQLDTWIYQTLGV